MEETRFAFLYMIVLYSADFWPRDILYVVVSTTTCGLFGSSLNFFSRTVSKQAGTPHFQPIICISSECLFYTQNTLREKFKCKNFIGVQRSMGQAKIVILQI